MQVTHDRTFVALGGKFIMNPDNLRIRVDFDPFDLFDVLERIGRNG